MLGIGQAIRQEVSDCIFWFKPLAVIGGIGLLWTMVLSCCCNLVKLLEIIPLLLIK